METMKMSEQTELRLQIRGLREHILKVEAEGLAGQLLVGWWLVGPLKFLASPVLEIAELVVPPITSVIPFSRKIVGLGLGGVSYVGRLAHEVGTSVGVLADNDDENFIIDATEELRRLLLERESNLHSAVGFGFGVGIDIVTALVNREKFLNWIITTKELKGFLMLSGVGKELQEEFFRLDAVSDMILLHKAQQQRRQIGTNLRPSKMQLADGYHFMKCSTAVYGISSINSAQAQKRITNLHLFETPESSRKLLGSRRTTPLTLRPTYRADEPHDLATRKAISDHIRVDEMEIIVFAKPGGDNHILRHFVAVDRARRQIVLSIRGTFSVSELIIDLDGTTREFCGGIAHRGIANQAELLWDKVGNIVLDALNEYPGFELVITGHSLGAGTACLLTILLCYKKTLFAQKCKIRCFAYASPPVFYPLSAAKEAVENTICYIHDDDAVPFLSIAAARELFDSMRVVKEYKETHMQSTIINSGVDPGLMDAVKKAGSETLANIPGAEQLFIPASNVIWMRGSSRDGYEAFVYKPDKLPEMFVDVDMIFDHFPAFYEESLKTLLIQSIAHNGTKASL